jgi:hypothetical protein
MTQGGSINMLSNIQKLQAALTIAIADEDFIGNTTKVNKAIEALTPKDELTKIFTQLKGNARRDFNDKKGEHVAGYSDLTRDAKIREYFTVRFQKHMDAPKTSKKATNMYNAFFNPVDSVPADGIADDIDDSEAA